MKMTPIAQGTGSPAGANIGQERMPATRIAAAKAAAEGREPTRQTRPSETPVDERIDRAERTMKRIKMRTQVSPDRPYQEAPSGEAPVVENTQTTIESANGDAVEPGQAATEETKPLSPAFAELARQRRSLQLEKKALAEEKAKFTQSIPNMDEYVSKADLQANPLKVFEAGVSYDAMTQAIMANPSAVGNPEIDELKKEIRALKEGVDKSFSSRETQAEEAALGEMLDEAEALASIGDEYELIRDEKAFDQVLTKIYDTYKKTGKLLNVPDVMKQVETNLFEKTKKKLELNKFKSIYQSQQVQQPQQRQQPGMRTLTNRDGASALMSRRDRAMAAMNGTLRK